MNEMNFDSRGVAEALRPFRRALLEDEALHLDEIPRRKDTDRNFWMLPCYDEAIEALERLPTFAEYAAGTGKVPWRPDEKLPRWMADAYICGYVRGLGDVFMTLRQWLGAEQFWELCAVLESVRDDSRKRKREQRRESRRRRARRRSSVRKEARRR